MKTLRYIVAPAEGPPERKSPPSVNGLERGESDNKSTPLTKTENTPHRKPGRPRLTAFVSDEHRIADGLESVAKLAAAQFDRAPNLRTERVARLTLHAWTAQRRAMRAHSTEKRKDPQP